MCLFVFCLECKKASHGTANCSNLQQETAMVGSVDQDPDQGESEKNKDYEVFEAMLRKSGPQR